MSGPPDTPEEVVVLTRADRTQFPIGRDNVDRQKIVDCETMFTGKPTLSTAKGQPRDTSRRDGADRSGEAEMLGRAVQFGPDHSRFRAHSSRSRTRSEERRV